MDTVTRGREALAAGRWEEARGAFESALAEAESPQALLGLADALWWAGEAAECVGHRERAYALLRRSGDLPEAAGIAIYLALDYKKVLGNAAAASGWLARAERLVRNAPEGPLQGWLCWARAVVSAQPRRSVALAEQALACARETRDVELELCALAELGGALVEAGEPERGLALIDEAMAGTFGGESGSRETVVATCCSMMTACDSVADLARAVEWCRVADGFMRTYGCPFLFADCRMRYGSVLLATGHWDDAERELAAAMRAAPAETAYHAQARVRLAELRLRQGRLEEADGLLSPVADRAAARLGLAALRLARGEAAVAAASLRRFVDSVEGDDRAAARALELLVEACLADGDEGGAGDAAERLATLELAKSDDRVAAHVACARGRVALAAGRPAEAIARLERAMDLFAGCNLPYEAARVRLALAGALAGERPDVAIPEAAGALSTFERLGAGDVDAAAALLRSLGAPARTGPRDVGVLTAREREVLDLLAEGLSNPEIAQRLFISRKTASHHVSNVLSKLGLRNRAEAVGYALRTFPDRAAR